MSKLNVTTHEKIWGRGFLHKSNRCRPKKKKFPIFARGFSKIVIVECDSMSTELTPAENAHQL
jgi:hypothetical protein